MAGCHIYDASNMAPSSVDDVARFVKCSTQKGYKEFYRIEVY
jgi:hypothetical protein